MTMTRELAFEITGLRTKLRKLRDKASAAEQEEIDRQIARLDPLEGRASAIVIKATDADFAALSDMLSKKTKGIDEAISGIKKVADAIKIAAQLIDTILALVT